MFFVLVSSLLTNLQAFYYVIIASHNYSACKNVQCIDTPQVCTWPYSPEVDLDEIYLSFACFVISCRLYPSSTSFIISSWMWRTSSFACSWSDSSFSLCEHRLSAWLKPTCKYETHAKFPIINTLTHLVQINELLKPPTAWIFLLQQAFYYLED